MIKKLIVAVVLALPLFGASAQTLKIGLLDTQSVFQVMPDTQEAQKKISEIAQQYDSEYKKLETEMNRLLDEFKALPESTLPASRERRARELQDYQVKIQQFEQSVQQDLQQKQAELMQPILSKIKDAAEAVAKENGYSLIQDSNPQQTLYYAAPVTDVTPLVKAKLGIK